MPDEKCKECPCNKAARWQEDFPVRWENDNYVTRREMVKFLGLGSMFITAANFVAAAVPRMSHPQQFPRIKIAQASALTVGASQLFRYPTEEEPCILVRDRAGELVAYSQVCTHLSCAVVHRPEENTLFCPCHRGYFTVEEGRPYAGPPTRSLPRIRLAFEGDEVYATGVQVV